MIGVVKLASAKHGARVFLRSTTRRGLSSSSSSNSKPPLQKFVSNVTVEAMEKDPELYAYMKANFPHAVIPDYRPPELPHVSKLNSFGETGGASILKSLTTTTTTTANNKPEEP
eukprot:scaffold14799_cov109-Amphora_coffeaeformis.AAC.1